MTGPGDHEEMKATDGVVSHVKSSNTSIKLNHREALESGANTGG